MNELLRLGDILKLYPNQFVAAVTVRNKAGIAEQFSVLKACTGIDEAVEECEVMRKCDVDAVLIPCFEGDLHEVMSTTEIAYMYRGMFYKQCHTETPHRKLTFDEIVAIFCSVTH